MAKRKYQEKLAARKAAAAKRKPVKEIQQAAKTLEKADFTKHLNEGLEDPQYPYQKGTIQDLARDFGDETGILITPQPAKEPAWGLLLLFVFVGAACIISIGAIV